MTVDMERLKVALAGRYAIEREVGHGGTAVVHLAQDVKYGRSVAVKVLRPEVAACLGPDRFLREIRITASLCHFSPDSSPVVFVIGSQAFSPDRGPGVFAR